MRVLREYLAAASILLPVALPVAIVALTVAGITHAAWSNVVAQQPLTLECREYEPGKSKCVSPLPMMAEKHTALLWIEQLGVNQKVYKVNVEGKCFIVFETAFNSSNAHNTVGISTQPVACQ